MDFKNLVKEIQEFKGVSRKSSIDNVISLLTEEYNDSILWEYINIDILNLLIYISGNKSRTLYAPTQFLNSKISLFP